VGGGWAEGRFTTTPEVTNIPQEQALQSLRASDLEYTTQEAFSEDVAVGSVISTDPAGNARTLRGTRVTVVISKGPERYMMPDVVGQKLSQARSAIESAHLVVGQVKEDWSESVETDMIISASASAGALLPPGSNIDLVVSKGRQPLAIKDYTNKDADQASKELKDQGFKVEVAEAHSDTVAAGLVISQDPASGTGHRGDTVKLVKSLGPEMVTVPDVGHKRTDEAQKDRRHPCPEGCVGVAPLANAGESECGDDGCAGHAEYGENTNIVQSNEHRTDSAEFCECGPA